MPLEQVVLLVPVKDEQNQPLRAPSPEGADWPVLGPAPDTDTVGRVRAILTETFDAQVIRLDRFARHLALSQGGDASLGAPLYLLLSEEEGGFARHGFWLQEAGGRRPMPVSYVDVVAGDFHLERGDFESTFAHEMGHVIVRTLVGDITTGRIRKQHSSLVVTDYPTAFDEGFAIHFELLVQDTTANPYLLGQRRPRAHDLIAKWVSNVDGALRQDGVRRNHFVHRKALPALALEPGADRYDVWRDCETSAAFLTDELKNGQAMMASEGVGAALFYRLMTSPAVRERYRDRDFYLPFLAPGEALGEPASQFGPYENAALKVMAAMRVLGQRPHDPARPLLAELVQAYAGLFPDEAVDVYRLFLETTWGATVSPAIAAELEALARRGRLGDVRTFQRGFKGAFERLMALAGDLAAGERSLDDGLGPELWVLNEEFLIARAAWEYERTKPMAVNLNTATEAELMTFDGVDLNLARRLVAARGRTGFFRSLEDVRGVGGVTASLVERWEAMAARMDEVGPVARL